MRRAVIFANGLVPEFDPIRGLIQADDIFIAADGGTRHALALGLAPSIIIGDLDSLTADQKRQATEKGARLIPYPANKNQTDLELAVDYAIEQGFQKILIIGALGGRFDQSLSNAFLLADPRLAELDIRLDDGLEEVFLIRDQAEVWGAPGDIVSLIPFGGPAYGVTTENLRWPLRGEILFPEKTRGVSNELLGERATVSLSSGLLVAVHRRNL